MQCLGLGSSMIGMLVIDEMMTGSGVMDGTMVIHQVAMQQWTSSNGPILGIKMMVSGSGVDLLPGRIARIGDKMESGRSEHGVGVTGTLVVDGLTMASGMSAENSTHGATVRLERQMPVNLDQAGAVEESAPSTSNSEGKSGKTREPKTGKEVIPSWDGTTPIRDYKKRIDLLLVHHGHRPRVPCRTTGRAALRSCLARSGHHGCHFTSSPRRSTTPTGTFAV